MTAPSIANADLQYAEIVDALSTFLLGNGVQVISADLSGRGLAGNLFWPAKGAKPFLVLFETAEDAVARGLLEGEVPSHVLARWVPNAEALLLRHRERRRQVSLASIGGVRAEPGTLLVEFSRRLEKEGFSGDFNLKPSVPAWPAWQGLLARQIIAGEPVARRLSGELEAAALPLSAELYDHDHAALELHALSRDREQLSVEREQVQASDEQGEREKIAAAEECALLRDHIRLLEQAAEERAEDDLNKQRDLAKLKLDLTAARDRVEGLEATLSGLTSQLTRSQSSLDALTGRKQELLEEFGRFMDKILNGGELKWPKGMRRAQQIRIVRDYGVVDPEWYLQYHQDVAQAGAEPFRHYIDHGAKEGRAPNARFL